MAAKKPIFEKARKTSGRDDFFDISAIFGRPVALLILPYLYRTPLSPVHVTTLAFIVGTLSAALVATGSRYGLVAGAILLQVKNILDTVDGHLARARNRPSRIGSLLDSDTDFLINLFLFLAIGCHLSDQNFRSPVIPMVLLAFISSLLQCSYYVYYLRKHLTVTSDPHVEFLETGSNGFPLTPVHRSIEKKFLFFLERFYALAYGWQDRLIEWVDDLSLSRSRRPVADPLDTKRRLVAWYHNRRLLKLSSLLGLGTQLFFISFMAAIDRLDIYLYIPVLAGNGYLLWLIRYRIRRYVRGEGFVSTH